MRGRVLRIRKARLEDLGAVTEIYNEAVVNTVSTFHLHPREEEHQLSWFYRHGENYPILVGEEGDMVLGWACLSPFSEREGYRYTVTDSVYVASCFRCQGVGMQLLTALCDEAGQLGYHSIVGVIARENTASVRLHERAGFTLRGELREAGFKFGKWVDIWYYQKLLRSS